MEGSEELNRLRVFSIAFALASLPAALYSIVLSLPYSFIPIFALISISPLAGKLLGGRRAEIFSIWAGAAVVSTMLVSLFLSHTVHGLGYLFFSVLLSIQLSAPVALAFACCFESRAHVLFASSAAANAIAFLSLSSIQSFSGSAQLYLNYTSTWGSVASMAWALFARGQAIGALIQPSSPLMLYIAAPGVLAVLLLTLLHPLLCSGSVHPLRSRNYTWALLLGSLLSSAYFFAERSIPQLQLPLETIPAALVLLMGAYFMRSSQSKRAGGSAGRAHRQTAGKTQKWP